ncbi:hypothetical protein WN51_07955 [Melipona quadrifasciata]|uniref:Uncharacterized protein n=1 Tax=Melipona quadrifasciata TaxID=166423 RepID=A0A0M8ZQU9_9HYME|nr:hypothetical protein WN51_07955 [Melipona quadrifasciata]
MSSNTLHAPISKDSCDSGSFCGGEAVVVRYDVMARRREPPIGLPYGKRFLTRSSLSVNWINFLPGPNFGARVTERQSARAPERKQSDQLGNDKIQVGTCVTRMTRNHMQVKTLTMFEELAIAEEEELNNDGDSLDNIQ